MKRQFFYIISLFILFVSCERLYDTPLDDDRLNAGINDPKPQYYMQLYDPIEDKGQYWIPDRSNNFQMPVYFHELYGTDSPNRNNPAVEGGEITKKSGDGLQYHLLCQSFAGIADQMLAAGKIHTGVWMNGGNGIKSYKSFMKANKIFPTWISWAGDILTNPEFASADGGVVETMGKKYVLTDVNANPESGVVAVTASHVYGAVIVDVRDEDFFKENGYEMVYDATHKSTADAWHEFKDKCNNDALVVMPVHTAELADFAIANKLFTVNLNKRYNKPQSGQNAALFKEILQWLEPLSPVYGWEPGVGEDVFVKPVSMSGNMMLANADLNIPYFSRNYKEKQTQILAKVVNPHDIDYDQPGKYVSFYLSDGPHLGWMMNGFYENYMGDMNTDVTKMSYGVTVSNLAMHCPEQFRYIMRSQPNTATYIESFGGGYWYSDNFGLTRPNRKALLKEFAEKIAAHMRQHRIKILEQIAFDPVCPASFETYQAMVDANDQLEGIVTINYDGSYSDVPDDQKILWVTNKAGYDIPVVSIRYSIWNFERHNNLKTDGTPTYIAHKLNNLTEENAKYSAVILHAWSNFSDTGMSDDEVAEKQEGGVRGPSAVEMCTRRLDDDIHVVNMQELIWRIRMEYRPEQTKKFLNTYF